jgi:hypothetical protein
MNYQLGANAFVVKPSGIEERAELARHIKGFWLQFNEPPAPWNQKLYSSSNSTT